MIAVSNVAIISLVAGVVVALAFIGGIVALALRGREPKPDIPAGMRPGPADEVLERRLIERFVGFNLIFVLFFAVWLPIAWLREPNTNQANAVELTERSVERGERWYAIADENNPLGFSCARCHGAEAEGGVVPFQGEAYPAPSLVEVCGRLTIDEIRTTLEQGRQGTPMPSWSVRFEGPMNDQQIDDLINFMLTIQEVPDEENLCLNPEAAEEEAEEEEA